MAAAGVPQVPTTAPPTEDRPSADSLVTAGEIPVFDASGKEVPFKSLYEVKKAEDGTALDGGNITMVIFIRHFFCSLCQAYLSAIAQSISPESLTATSPHKQIVIIGCGSHTLISNYAADTKCPFPIYAEPTQRLHTILGMIKTLKSGSAPKYMEGHGILEMVRKGVSQGFGWGGPFKGGDIQQVGGEFMYVNGECVWCHRMKTTRDHVEVEDLKKVMGLDASTPSAAPV